MHTYTVEVINKQSGEVVREIRVESGNGERGARFATMFWISDSEMPGHAYLGE